MKFVHISIIWCQTSILSHVKSLIQHCSRQGDLLNWPWASLSCTVDCVIISAWITYSSFPAAGIITYLGQMTPLFFLNPQLRICLLMLERGGRERKRERNRCEGETSINCLFAGSLTGYWTCSLGMCPDQGLNPQLFGAQNNAPTQPSGRSWMTPFKRRLSASSQHTVKFEVFICDPWILYTALAVTITVCCGL